MKPNRITELGLARTFQNIRLFSTMTALENVMIGRHPKLKAGIFGAIFRDSRTKEEEKQVIEDSLVILRKLGLAKYANEPASSLPYGAQRLLEIARAMATEPQLLLLDEPAAGMNPHETRELDRTITRIRDEEGITILLIEHDMSLVMSLSERIYVLDYGKLIAEGSPAASEGRSCRHQGLPGRMSMLKVDNIHTYYGNIEAIKGISLEVEKGEIICLIGANGAGKSTTLMSISGIAPPRRGTITLDGQDITGMPPHKIVTMGMSQVPEGRRIFPQLTVLENLDMGAYLRREKDEIKRDLEYVFELFPILSQRRNQTGGTLSGGEQQMLAISRALMAKPGILLLDEPSLGLAPLIVQRIFEIITRINKEQGTTIFLVEQNANMALKIADRGYVLQNGKIVKTDTAAALMEDQEVRDAYLGV